MDLSFRWGGPLWPVFNCEIFRQLAFRQSLHICSSVDTIFKISFHDDSLDCFFGPWGGTSRDDCLHQTSVDNHRWLPLIHLMSSCFHLGSNMYTENRTRPCSAESTCADACCQDHHSDHSKENKAQTCGIQPWWAHAMWRCAFSLAHAVLLARCTSNSLHLGLPATFVLHSLGFLHFGFKAFCVRKKNNLL